jgi:gluconate 2-dehydrogenase gamma chain
MSNRPNNSSEEADSFDLVGSDDQRVSASMQPQAEAPVDAAQPEASTNAPVTRRHALKVLGAVPLAGAFTGAMTWDQQPVVTQPGHAHPAPPRTRSNRAAPPTKHAFFTAAEFRLVGVLADDIIPRDAQSGSATEAGVPAFMDFHLTVPESSEDSRIAMRGGLAWIDRESRKRFRVSYARATVEQRHALLDDIAWPKKAKPEFSTGTAFFTRFRDMVASGYYSSAMGWQDLKYTGNVYNATWQGCPEAAMTKLGVSQALMNTRIPPQ